MSKTLSLSLFAIGVFQVASVFPAQEKADKLDVLAKEAGEQFIKAIQTDIEAVMKMVDVPFCYLGARENIKDRQLLRVKLELIVQRNQETKKTVKLKLQSISSFGDFEEQFKDFKRDLELLKEVLEKADRVLIYTQADDLKRDDRTAVFVRIREGKPKVVGIR
jgi:hypothetical protein